MKELDLDEGEESEAAEEEEDSISFFDKEGNKVKIEQDELFYIQSLMGKNVDWEAFTEKNQRRLDKIKKVDDKIDQVTKL